MSNANTDFLDPDLLKDAEATSQRRALSGPEEPLVTARVPPFTTPLPPPSLPPVAMPPPAKPAVPDSVAPTARSSEAPAPAIAPTTMDGTTRYRRPVEAVSKQSWFKAILASTFPPPAAIPGARSASLQRKLVIASVAAAVFFAIFGLVLALRGVPSDPTMSPLVMAAVVLGRAILAIGAGAFSYGLLRIAYRIAR